MPELLDLDDDTVQRIMQFCNFAFFRHREAGPHTIRLLDSGELTMDQILQMTSVRISVCNRKALCAYWTTHNGCYEQDGTWVPGKYFECRPNIRKTYNSDVKLIRVEVSSFDVTLEILDMLSKLKEIHPLAEFPDLDCFDNDD